MQQWYICPRCRQYVQYGQMQCNYCGFPLYWQAPPSPLVRKLKSVFEILSQKAPPTAIPHSFPTSAIYATSSIRSTCLARTDSFACSTASARPTRCCTNSPACADFFAGTYPPARPSQLRPSNLFSLNSLHQIFLLRLYNLQRLLRQTN